MTIMKGILIVLFLAGTFAFAAAALFLWKVRKKFLERNDSEKRHYIECALNDYRNGIYPGETDRKAVELLRHLSAENYRSLLEFDQ